MSQLYPVTRQLLCTAGINFTTLTWGVLLVGNDYVPNFTSHQHVSDVSGAGTILSRAAVTATVAAGRVALTQALFASVTGIQANAIVLYKNTGLDSTSTLIAYVDAVTGLPFTPTGGNVRVTFDSGAVGAFTV